MSETNKLKRPPLAPVGIVLGVVLMLVAGYGYLDWSSLGFPDGHLTNFERETRDLRFGVFISNIISGFLGIAYGFGWIRPSRIITLALVLAFVLVAIPSALLPSCASLPGCPQVYETVTGHTFIDGGGG